MISPETLASELPLFVTNSGLPPPEVTSRLTLQAARTTVPRLLDLALAACPERPTKLVEWASLSHPSAPELGKLLDQHGSDKAGGHNYHHLYAHILGPKRELELFVLEVGLGSNNLDVTGNMGAGARPGASLRAWRDFLPHGHIYGAEVDRRVLFAEERIETFFVDQTDTSTFGPLERDLPPLDLVIDDGLHSPHSNLAVAAFALKKLRHGGWLVIEDISAASVPIWHLAKLLLPTDKWNAMVIRADAGFHLFAAERL